tara:strand:- start:678 stop:2399 length:1722 start_codon:yes stop_codon:yes gene_type:complete
MMSQQPIPEYPPVGVIRLFDSIQPPLSQGEYKIQMKQTFPQQVDGKSTDMPTNSVQNKYIKVDGSRWSIDPLTVHSRSPPKNEQGVKLDYTLPKIVFQSKTLPWERQIPGTGQNNPWMCLLLIREDEFEDYCRILPDQLTDNDTLTGTSHDIEPDGSPPIQIKILEITDKLLKAIGPKQDELSLLSHGLQVNPMDKELCGNDEDGLFSVVLSNRVPSVPDTKYTACLVSVEDCLFDLPNHREVSYISQPSTLVKEKPAYGEPTMEVAKSAGLDRKKSVRNDNKTLSQQMRPTSGTHSGVKKHLVLLDHWNFKTGSGGDFESKIKSLRFRSRENHSDDIGELGSVYDFADGAGDDRIYEPALLGNDMDPDVSVNSFLFTEIVEHDGIRRPCLYRSPCVAIPVNHEPKQEPYLNSDDARGLEPSSGLDVIHHSAAFELGRLLAMSDPKFIDSLSRWRNLWNKKQERKKYREELVLESALDLDHERMYNENVSIQSTIQKGILTNSSAKYEPLLEKVEGKLETRMGNEVHDFDEAQFKVIGKDMELPEHMSIASPEAVEVMLKEQLTRGGENLARR